MRMNALGNGVAPPRKLSQKDNAFSYRHGVISPHRQQEKTEPSSPQSEEHGSASMVSMPQRVLGPARALTGRCTAVASKPLSRSPTRLGHPLSPASREMSTGTSGVWRNAQRAVSIETDGPFGKSMPLPIGSVGRAT